jgi:ornithine carbamoyltransferase
MPADVTPHWPSNRSLQILLDLSRNEFETIIELAAEIKAALSESRQLDSLRGRIVALLFQTPSTRTRVSFEAATLRLGGSAMYLQSDRLKLGGGEPVEDTARVLSEYCDAIVARVWPHSTLVELAEHSLVPVVNACTDVDHPTQAICDLFTVYEAFGPLAGLKMTFVGTGNNMCCALMLGCAMAGMQMSIACPPGFEPEPRMLAAARDLASTAGTAIEIDHDAKSAVANADVIYTDIWEVPGRDDLSIDNVEVDWARYRLDDALLACATPRTMVMHCGDAQRGKEISTELMVSPRSLIWRQAANKLYGGAAVLQYVIGG